MRSNRLKIEINKPVEKVFEFTLDPKNTPKWVDSIQVEETDVWPPRLGAIYRNRGNIDKWYEYEITQFEKHKLFQLSEKDGVYHVKYTFTPIDENTTDFEYYEWVDKGDLISPLSQGALEKLKGVVENS